MRLVGWILSFRNELSSENDKARDMVAFRPSKTTASWRRSVFPCCAYMGEFTTRRIYVVSSGVIEYDSLRFRPIWFIHAQHQRNDYSSENVVPLHSFIGPEMRDFRLNTVCSMHFTLRKENFIAWV